MLEKELGQAIKMAQQANRDIRRIQALLGHRQVTTTMIYLHVSRKTLSKIPSPLDLFDSQSSPKGDTSDDHDH